MLPQSFLLAAVTVASTSFHSSRICRCCVASPKDLLPPRLLLIALKSMHERDPMRCNLNPSASVASSASLSDSHAATRDAVDDGLRFVRQDGSKLDVQSAGLSRLELVIIITVILVIILTSIASCASLVVALPPPMTVAMAFSSTPSSRGG